MSAPIYLDYQATTPLAPEALAAMMPFLEGNFANPHSSHAMGRAAKAAVELAREQVAALLPPGGAVTFTSGATEALNWAIRCGTLDVATLATEHAAVLDNARPVDEDGRHFNILPVSQDGLVDVEDVRHALHLDTGLFAAMLVNNEIGVIQPVAALAALAHEVGALFLCDAVQGYGRVPIPQECDLIAVSAHKLHGPKGIGALWIRDGLALDSLLFGGGQEKAGRSGTLSPALCAGFGAAAKLAKERSEADLGHVERLWTVARELTADWTLNGSAEQRYHGNLNLRRDGVDAGRLMSEVRGVAFSAGSACASGSGRPSHVLAALGLSDRQARSSIRLGFGRYTTERELRTALDLINAAAARQVGLAA